MLRGVAEGLRQSVRQMDIVARYGGEEFAVITPATALVDAEPGAIRLGGHIAGCQFDFEGKTLKVTVSGGLAQALTGEDDASLIKRADEALYSAKRAGRNCVFSHNGETTGPSGSINPQGLQSLSASGNVTPGNSVAASSMGQSPANSPATDLTSAPQQTDAAPDGSIPDRRANRSAESNVVLRGNSPPCRRVASV